MILDKIISPALPILYHWSDIIPACGDHDNDVKSAIRKNLDDAAIPDLNRDNTYFGDRSFIRVMLKGFKNYQQLIGVRSFGIHLDLCHFLLVEPGFFVKVMDPKLHGELTQAEITKLLDLDSWTKVVHHCIESAIKPYRDMIKNGKMRANIPIL